MAENASLIHFISFITASKRRKGIKRNSGKITLHEWYTASSNLFLDYCTDLGGFPSLDRNSFDSLELIKEKTIFDLRVSKKNAHVPYCNRKTFKFLKLLLRWVSQVGIKTVRILTPNEWWTDEQKNSVWLTIETFICQYTVTRNWEIAHKSISNMNCQN